MRIIHRVSFNETHNFEFASIVNKLNIEKILTKLPGSGGNLVTILIEESNCHWPKIIEMANLTKYVDIVETYFSDAEIRNSEWLRVIPIFEQGYPQPESHWPLKQSSYKLLCEKCCIRHQIGSIRIKKDPKLGKNSFMTLIWSGETFCTPEVIQEFRLLHAIGFEAWDVVIHKTGETSKILHQLHASQIASPGLIPDSNEMINHCSICGREKYKSHVKGLMKISRDAINPDVDFILTNEWFGSGYIAYRELLVSNRIASLVLNKGWQGVRFKVVELT